MRRLGCARGMTAGMFGGGSICIVESSHKVPPVPRRHGVGHSACRSTTTDRNTQVLERIQMSNRM